MVRDIIQDKLESRNLDYFYNESNGQYIIDIEGSKFVISLDKHVDDKGFSSVLSSCLYEKEGNREILVELKLNSDDTEDTIEFLFYYIEFLQYSEGELYELTNKQIEDRISRILKGSGYDNVVKIQVTGQNPALNMGIVEKPLNRTQLVELMDKAIEDNDKESYEKYQQMLNALKESVSFTYLKKFRDFLD
jgi:hypothetical protein